jgi:hypothetical protein
MLLIRAAQMSVFENEALYGCIAAYLQSAYPAQFARMGASEAGTLVRGGIDDASARGLRDPAAVRKYVHVAFLLGREFLPKHQWAKRILANRRFTHEVVRMRALEGAAARYLADSSPQRDLEKTSKIM